MKNNQTNHTHKNKNNAKHDKFLTLIMHLLSYDTPSGKEQIMQPFITKSLQLLGFSYKIDEIGNIYAVRGKANKYPLLNAHMDIVTRSYSTSSYYSYGYDDDYDWYYGLSAAQINNSKPKVVVGALPKRTCTTCVEFDNCVSVMQSQTSEILTRSEAIEDLLCVNLAEKCSGYVQDILKTPTTKKKEEPVKPKQFTIKYNEKDGTIKGNGVRVLGGDDKCGIAIALQVAKELQHKPMKLLFTVQEETGCVGVKKFIETNKEWLHDLSYSITIDRRGSEDLLYKSCSKLNCSIDFACILAFHALKAGIEPKFNNGSVADVIHLRNFCEAVNISAGYYQPHTISEYVNYNDMRKIKNWVKNILTNIS